MYICAAADDDVCVCLRVCVIIERVFRRQTHT